MEDGKARGLAADGKWITGGSPHGSVRWEDDVPPAFGQSEQLHFWWGLQSTLCVALDSQSRRVLWLSYLGFNSIEIVFPPHRAWLT